MTSPLGHLDTSPVELSYQEQFNADVLRSVAFLDAIELRLSKSDRGEGVETSQLFSHDDAIVTSSILLAPTFMDEHNVLLDFPIILKRETEHNFMVGFPSNGVPIVILSILPSTGGLSAIEGDLHRFHDHIAHEHKHVLDWQRTGSPGILPAACANSILDDIAYYNCAEEVSAFMHGAAVAYLIKVRKIARDKNGHVNIRLAPLVRKMKSELLLSVDLAFRVMVKVKNWKLVFKTLMGFIDGCMRPMLKDMTVLHTRSKLGSRSRVMKESPDGLTFTP